MSQASVAGRPGQSLDVPGLVKEAGLAALVALALSLTMVGFQTVSVQSILTVETRFIAVALAVGLVFLGRLAFGLIRAGYALPGLIGAAAVCAGGYFFQSDAPAVNVIAIGGGAILAIQAIAVLFTGGPRAADTAKPPVMDAVAAWVQQSSTIVAPLAIAFAVALPLLFSDRYTVDVATLVLTYVMLGWGLNIIVGLAGLLDLGYVAFYAVGAYSYALLGTTFGWSFWICLPLAGILAAMSGLLLGFPVLRLRGDYFAIVTLGFGEIIRIILLNWYPVTKGPDGIGNIPRPSFFGIAEFGRTAEDGGMTFHQLFGLDYSGMHRVVFLYYLILVLALIVNVVSLRLRRLPIGRSWEALREDDIACQSLGINRRNIKLAAFTISAMFGGLAGSFFATRQGFISPESFTFLESAIILAIVVLGGMGSQTGVVIATLLLIGLPEVFRELEQYRMLAFGGAMVFIMVWRPRGLLAHRDPSIRLNRKGEPVPDPGGGVPQRAGAPAQ